MSRCPLSDDAFNNGIGMIGLYNLCSSFEIKCKQLESERDALQARVTRLEDVILAADKFLDAVQDDVEIDYHDWVCKVADARTAYNFAKQTAKESKP